MFVALTACDAGDWRVEVTGPRVGFSEWRRPCTEIRQAETPTALVRRGFEARIRDQHLVKPAPLNCVLELYSEQELVALSHEGDSVAELAIIYLDFVQSGDTCDRLRAHEAKLLEIGSVPYSPDDGRKLGFRIGFLPEALMIVAEARGVCGGDENQAFEKVWENGLDIQSISGETARTR